MIAIGRKFNHWEVKDSYMLPTGHGSRNFCTVECDCEAKTLRPNVDAQSLIRGTSQSCGHLGRGPRPNSKGQKNRKRVSRL